MTTQEIQPQITHPQFAQQVTQFVNPAIPADVWTTEVLTSISTVIERANIGSQNLLQAKLMTSFFSPNQGIVVGISASPEDTRYGL